MSYLSVGALALALCGCGQAAAAQGRTSGAWPAPITPAEPSVQSVLTPSATVEPPATATRAPADVMLRDDDPISVAGDTIRLARGEAGALAGSPLTLRFVEVLEDSRCPAEVNCFWAGRAVVSVEARVGAGAPELLTLGRPGVTADAPLTQTVGGITITLEDLEPYPAVGAPAPGDPYLLTLTLQLAEAGA